MNSVQIPTSGKVELYVCPECRGPLFCEAKETVAGLTSRQILRCGQCSRTFVGEDGSFDFVKVYHEDKASERMYYDHQYDHNKIKHLRKPFDVDKWAQRWYDPHWPECQIILRRLGNLDGKTILCLGNGSSVKEQYFVRLGAQVIHSDLSFEGVLQAKAEYDLGEFAERVVFHAIDAYQIPLRDSSVDVVYGFEFVHHLPDVPSFLDNVRRVLKPGGMCLFFDGAYSPLWQGAKMTLLRPLMKLSHILRRRSPEDLRATYAGGYKEEYLERLGQEHGFQRAFFERTTFFHYLMTHGVGSILGWNLPRFFYKAPGCIGRWMDLLLTERVGLLHRSRMELVWGFRR